MGRGRIIKFTGIFDDESCQFFNKNNSQISDAIYQLYLAASRIKEDYWSKVRSHVDVLKKEQNMAINRLSDQDFKSSTFVYYNPAIRYSNRKLNISWSVAHRAMPIVGVNGKKTLKRLDHHIKLEKSNSALLPGTYPSSKFILSAHAEWQRSFVLETESKLAVIRALSYKLSIVLSESEAVINEVNKQFDNDIKLTDPDSDSESSDQLLLQLRQTLNKNGDDANRLSKELGKLLISTPDNVLEQYGIHPDLKLTYFTDN